MCPSSVASRRSAVDIGLANTCFLRIRASAARAASARPRFGPSPQAASCSIRTVTASAWSSLVVTIRGTRAANRSASVMCRAAARLSPGASALPSAVRAFRRRTAPSPVCPDRRLRRLRPPLARPAAPAPGHLDWREKFQSAVLLVDCAHERILYSKSSPR